MKKEQSLTIRVSVLMGIIGELKPYSLRIFSTTKVSEGVVKGIFSSTRVFVINSLPNVPPTVSNPMSPITSANTLAITHILGELNGNEGVLVASKVADRVGITRSVIVNALRKFESAGVIESRSSGMKGTYIKVLNDVVFDELKRVKSAQQYDNH